jgi:hypothetical protein
MRPHWVFALTTGLLPVLAIRAPAGEAARAVIEWAVQALGGEEKLAKLQAVRTKAKGTVALEGGPAPLTTEIVSQWPSRTKTTIQVEIEGEKVTIVRVLNGNKAWQHANGETQELDAQEVAALQARVHETYVHTLVPLLRDKAFSLSPLGEAAVGGRPAVGVKVTAKGQKDVALYFDKGSGLLVKSACWGLNPTLGEITRETFYSDYQEKDGLKQPRKFMTRHNGEKYMEMEVTEFQILDRVDASEFVLP